MKNFKTEQEQFWASEFGNEYILRNIGSNLLASNINMFSKILSATRDVSSCIEFGANIGMNLQAIKLIKPDIEPYAIEINTEAVKLLEKVIPATNIYNGSILEYVPNRLFDFVFIKGVLIHINPNELEKVYEKLYNCCGSYLMIAEYYNPTPVSIPYRGHSEKLFKRDFAGEFMGRYPQMELLTYGFEYHGDNNFPQDDVTWFLMKKK
jgi:pseudaminic acid biosynthesis-associated methylase